MRSVFVAAGSFLTALLFLTFTPLAFGQGGTGTITGTITDPTGLGSRRSDRGSHERRNGSASIPRQPLPREIIRSRICRSAPTDCR